MQQIIRRKFNLSEINEILVDKIRQEAANTDLEGRVAQEPEIQVEAYETVGKFQEVNITFEWLGKIG